MKTIIDDLDVIFNQMRELSYNISDLQMRVKLNIDDYSEMELNVLPGSMVESKEKQIDFNKPCSNFERMVILEDLDKLEKTLYEVDGHICCILNNLKL